MLSIFFFALGATLAITSVTVGWMVTHARYARNGRRLNAAVLWNPRLLGWLTVMLALAGAALHLGLRFSPR